MRPTGTRAATRTSATSATRSPQSRATRPPRPSTRWATCAGRWPRRWAPWGSTSRSTTTRSRPAARAKSPRASARCAARPTRRSGTSTSSATSPISTARRPPSCPSRCSATTAPGCHVHQSLWMGDEPLFYDADGYAQLSDLGQALHRRAAQAQPLAARVLRADDQLLQAPGARLRSADLPRLLAAQPLRGGPHPHLRELAQEQASGVSARRTPRPTLTSPSRR